MALIEHVGHAIERPAGIKLFRSLGPRRARMAQRQLQRERERLLQIRTLWRLPVGPGQTIHAVELGDDLPQHYLDLASAYLRMAQWAEQREEASPVQWLLERAEIHREHSRLLLG